MIERHLRLHDELPALQPLPALWESIRERLDEEEAARPLWRRFWMPAAAAALLVAAFFLPRGEFRTRCYGVHGDVVESADGTISATEIARVRLVGGVLVTLDANTTIAVPEPERLVLRTGRIFLDVPVEERGFVVEAGELRVVTTGTAFLVDAAGLVWVESGTVSCNDVPVAAGERFPATASPPWRSPRAWFERPTLEAKILSPTTVQVVVRNEMPDPIELAPPTSGEPLFLATYGGHTFPLPSPGTSALRLYPVTLNPGRAFPIELRLPRPLEDREALFISYPSAGVRVEASR